MDNTGPTAGLTERALLVSVHLGRTTDEAIEDTLTELEELAGTAGFDVAGSVVQKRETLNPATVVGKGKVTEITRLANAEEVSVIIFDTDLTVAQQDRLSKATGLPVMDRTSLILEIFARHAVTKEGSTQVQLAQLTYMLPRIRGKGIELSRLGGGYASRGGAGETQLELDRREIRRRIRKLEKDLKGMDAVRASQRKQRTRAGLPSVCLVGYTNSGKSSLLNRLAGSSVPEKDQLFSTLDSTTRRVELADGQNIVISDTVGFIRKLPHQLVAAFRSTLEVVREADLLIHVIDATIEEGLSERLDSVSTVLTELGASEIPVLMAVNKVDLVETGRVRELEQFFPGAVFISARTGQGIEALLDTLLQKVSTYRRHSLKIPAVRGDVISSLYREGTVISTEIVDDMMIFEANIPKDKLFAFREWLF